MKTNININENSTKNDVVMNVSDIDVDDDDNVIPFSQEKIKKKERTNLKNQKYILKPIFYIQY